MIIYIQVTIPFPWIGSMSGTARLLLGSRVEPCSNRRTLGKPQSTGTFAMGIPVQNSTKLEVAEALYGTNSGGDDT